MEKDNRAAFGLDNSWVTSAEALGFRRDSQKRGNTGLFAAKTLSASGERTIGPSPTKPPSVGLDCEYRLHTIRPNGGVYFTCI